MSTHFALDDSMLRRSHDRVMASETWSSLWKTKRARIAGLGGMRCGNFPSLNFYVVCLRTSTESGEKRVKRKKTFLIKQSRNEINLIRWRGIRPLSHTKTFSFNHTQTMDVGSKIKLCSSCESPPFDDIIDLRLRFFILSG